MCRIGSDSLGGRGTHEGRRKASKREEAGWAEGPGGAWNMSCDRRPSKSRRSRHV